MQKKIYSFLLTLLLLMTGMQLAAQERRPIDSQHPLWFIHVDVWFKADPQKIIDLIPDEIKPYVCLNLSLSCGFDVEQNVYKMPQYAFQTYKSWATVCQQNGMWFTCQPASGGHTHIQDTDMATFEYFFKTFPNFLGWNYAEQFWGFEEPGDKSSGTTAGRWALFARLVEMSHQYGGFLTVSFCGNIWSHPLNPIGELKREKQFLKACRDYPESILFLYKYTTSSCFYNNESVCFGPFISGLTKNYGVRYDNCGWNGAMDALLGENHGKKYPASAGIGTVMEQMCVNGGAVWDGPELTWREECFHEVSQTQVDGYQRRQWQRFANMNGVWNDMFRMIINGTMYIPTREEVVQKTKIVIVNDVNSGSDEDKYATWGNLYDGIYKQNDPFNRGDGQWMNNFCYFKSTGRYGAIPMVINLYDDLSSQIPVQVKKSARTSRWGTIAKKQNDFNEQYPEVSKGDLYVNRFRNQLVTYTPYSYLNKKTTASADIPLQYNTCDTLSLQYDKLSSGLIREYADHIDFYLNNYRSDTTALRTDIITLKGVTAEPTYKFKRHETASGNIDGNKGIYDADAKTFTIKVKHRGAVDLTVNCTGAAERDNSLPVIEKQALPLPKQPELYRGSIIIEAEDMDFKDINTCVTDPYGQNWGAYNSVRGHAANGFMDMGTKNTGSLRHQLNLKEGQTGDYVISMRYTCTSRQGQVTLIVNGISQTVTCKKTATNEWINVSIEATLNEGKNNLVINNTSGLPMYIDQITYRPADVEPLKYYVNVVEDANGTVVPDKAEAFEGDTITLTVMPREGCQLKQLRVVNSVFYINDKTIDFNADDNTITFVMPHDNVTIQPEFSDETLALKLDYADVLAGTIPEGWRCVQENSEVHEYPNTYGSGTRTMSGFTGHQGKALYWRNGRAEYGRQSAYPLTLEPGNYKLVYAMAAWKETPLYKVQILPFGSSTPLKATNSISATPNANGNGSANLSSAQNRELDFTVTTAGKYVVSFVDATTSGGYHEFLLLECQLNRIMPSGIDIVHTGTGLKQGVYSISGVRRQGLQPGFNLVVDANGSARKIFIK